ncbi:hypothetical protein TWF730_008330 [Orbilia blumenaviensis]|uniref:Peptidase S8/S53 domain-containing protein n=1 Tax=Orbilia blumenaviensis TaxID=1796055 RepID=A0AAV9V5W2_9PEZI
MIGSCIFTFYLLFYLTWTADFNDPRISYYLDNEGIAEILGFETRLWWFVPKIEYMKNEPVLEKIHAHLVDFARDNQRKPEVDIYRSQSDHLGTIFFSLKLFITDDPEKIWHANRQYLLSYGEIPHSVADRFESVHDLKKMKVKRRFEGPEGGLGKKITLMARSGDSDLEEKYDTNIKGIEVFEEPFEDLQKLSQPKDTPLSELHGQYYRRTAGIPPTVIYMIDSGAWVSLVNTHKELSEVRLVDYLWAGPDPGVIIRDSDAYPHGTKVLSRIVGKRLGTAPHAAVVVVQLFNKYDYSSTAHYFDAMIRTYDHIVMKKPKSALINISWGIATGDQSGRYTSGSDKIIHKIKKDYDGVDASPEQEELGNLSTPEVVVRLSRYIVEHMENLGYVKIVTCVGNIEGEPAGLPAEEMERFPKTVVTLGATGIDDRIINQYWDQVRAYVPAQNIMVANYDPVDKSEAILPDDGVSFGTGSVTGMLATFLSEGVHIDNVIEHLYKLAHSRKPPDVEDPEGYYGPIVFNGIEKSEWPFTVGDQERLEEYTLF